MGTSETCGLTAYEIQDCEAVRFSKRQGRSGRSPLVFKPRLCLVAASISWAELRVTPWSTTCIGATRDKNLAVPKPHLAL